MNKLSKNKEQQSSKVSEQIEDLILSTNAIKSHRNIRKLVSRAVDKSSNSLIDQRKENKESEGSWLSFQPIQSLMIQLKKFDIKKSISKIIGGDKFDQKESVSCITENDLERKSCQKFLDKIEDKDTTQILNINECIINKKGTNSNYQKEKIRNSNQINSNQNININYENSSQCLQESECSSKSNQPNDQFRHFSQNIIGIHSTQNNLLDYSNLFEKKKSSFRKPSMNNLYKEKHSNSPNTLQRLLVFYGNHQMIPSTTTLNEQQIIKPIPINSSSIHLTISHQKMESLSHLKSQSDRNFLNKVKETAEMQIERIIKQERNRNRINWFMVDECNNQNIKLKEIKQRELEQEKNQIQQKSVFKKVHKKIIQSKAFSVQEEGDSSSSISPSFQVKKKRKQIKKQKVLSEIQTSCCSSDEGQSIKENKNIKQKRDQQQFCSSIKKQMDSKEEFCQISLKMTENGQGFNQLFSKIKKLDSQEQNEQESLNKIMNIQAIQSPQLEQQKQFDIDILFNQSVTKNSPVFLPTSNRLSQTLPSRSLFEDKNEEFTNSLTSPQSNNQSEQDLNKNHLEDSKFEGQEVLQNIVIKNYSRQNMILEQEKINIEGQQIFNNSEETDDEKEKENISLNLDKWSKQTFNEKIEIKLDQGGEFPQCNSKSNDEQEINNITSSSKHEMKLSLPNQNSILSSNNDFVTSSTLTSDLIIQRQLQNIEDTQTEGASMINKSFENNLQQEKKFEIQKDKNQEMNCLKNPMINDIPNKIQDQKSDKQDRNYGSLAWNNNYNQNNIDDDTAMKIENIDSPKNVNNFFSSPMNTLMNYSCQNMNFQTPNNYFQANNNNINIFNNINNNINSCFSNQNLINFEVNNINDYKSDFLKENQGASALFLNNSGTKNKIIFQNAYLNDTQCIQQPVSQAPSDNFLFGNNNQQNKGTTRKEQSSRAYKLMGMSNNSNSVRIH